jgi:hypothetical protein
MGSKLFNNFYQSSAVLRFNCFVEACFHCNYISNNLKNVTEQDRRVL